MSAKRVHLRRLLIVAPFAVAFLLASIAVAGLSAPNKANAQGTAAVDIANFAFSPATLTIEVGTTVTWTNSDSAPHTATGDTFDTGELAQGESGSVTFDTEGTFNYICSIHPDMMGTIVVTAAGGEEPAPAEPTTPATGMPSTGSGSSLDSAASQTNLLFIAAAVAAALGLVALRLRHAAIRR